MDFRCLLSSGCSEERVLLLIAACGNGLFFLYGCCFSVVFYAVSILIYFCILEWLEYNLHDSIPSTLFSLCNENIPLSRKGFVRQALKSLKSTLKHAVMCLCVWCCSVTLRSIPQCLYSVCWVRAFFVAEGCCRAWWVSLGSCDHIVALAEAFCVVPRGAHSAYSYIITSKWLQKSMECCSCRGRFLKAVENHSIPVRCPRTRFWKPPRHDQPTTNHTLLVLVQAVSPKASCTSYGYWKYTTGSVCCILWIPGEKCQETSMKPTPFLYEIWHWR